MPTENKNNIIVEHLSKLDHEDFKRALLVSLLNAAVNYIEADREEGCDEEDDTEEAVRRRTPFEVASIEKYTSLSDVFVKVDYCGLQWYFVSVFQTGAYTEQDVANSKQRYTEVSGDKI